MKGQTVRMAGTIVSMVIVFIVFLWVLSVVLGSPDCDELANNTAYNLKVAIDQVSSTNFPSTFGDAPVSGQYASAVVRLCQEDYVFSKLAGQGKADNPLDQAYSWILKLSGGEPQYKIYYEIFPDEGLTWKESYPWNGGAASTLLFWGALRGVSYGIERLSPYIGTALNARTIYKIFKWTKGASTISNTATTAISTVTKTVSKPSTFSRIVSSLNTFKFWFFEGNATETPKNIIMLDSGRRDAFEVIKLLNQMSTESIIEALADSDFIRKDARGNWLKVGYRIVVNNQELPLIFEDRAFENDNWVVTGHYAMAVRQQGGGELDASSVDWSSQDQSNIIKVAATETGNGYSLGSYDSSNYALMTYKPNELVGDMYNELVQSSEAYDKERANQLKSYWYWDEDASSAEAFSAADVTKTNYGSDLYSMGYDKAEKSLESFQKQGALTDSTVLHSGDISGMLNGFREAAFAGDSDSQNIQNAFMTILSDKSNGVYDRACSVLKGTEQCTLSVHDMFDALQSAQNSADRGMYNPNVGVGGIMLLWNDYSINVDVRIMDILMSEHSMISRSSANDNLMLTQVEPYNKANLQDSEILDIYHGQLDWLSQSGHTIDNLAQGMGKVYLKRLASALKNFQSNPERYGWAANDVGFIIGLYKQEASTEQTQLPAAWQSGPMVSGLENRTSISFDAATAIGLAVKNVVFLNVKEIITPSSGVAKGFMLETTEGCLGNSLCVYSHGTILSPEKPMYLGEDAKAFTIKLYRPVNPLVNVAGIDGFLKQVPSNPRFYVVSPCFGMAKVWKTMNDGKSTIFISIDKYDMGDDSSNYCYADETLINEYGAIWFASTAGEVIEGVVTGGLKTAATTVGKLTLSQTIGKYILKIDPVMLAQGIAEAAISWPGAPFKSLTYETMVGQSGNNLINNIKTGSGTK